MARYALLIQPSANRVYSGTSVALTQAELQVFSQSVLDGRLSELSDATIGGVRYVTFAADGLGAADVAFLANLSSAYALFEVPSGWLADRFGSRRACAAARVRGRAAAA